MNPKLLKASGATKTERAGPQHRALGIAMLTTGINDVPDLLEEAAASWQGVIEESSGMGSDGGVTAEGSGDERGRWSATFATGVTLLNSGNSDATDSPVGAAAKKFPRKAVDHNEGEPGLV